MKNTKEDKKIQSLDKAVQESRLIYLKNRVNKALLAKKRYNLGIINKYKYISEMYEINKSLFEMSEIIKGTVIKNIALSGESVVFSISPPDIQFEVDKSCRSAPFEILNFGSYESEDEEMAYKLIKSKDVIFDVGAHLGWYALNLAKRFPRAQIFSFEPIFPTFKIFERNIRRNRIKNIKSNNFGFSNRKGFVNFYYSELGSPLASLHNISDIKNVKKIRCFLNLIDDFCLSKNIRKLNFIKCDVEGAEFLVLKGAQKTLERFYPMLFLELVESWCQKFRYSVNDILEFLSKIGYACFVANKQKLKRVNFINLKNVDRFNYFFLHLKKHKKQIQKFCDNK